MTSHEDVTSRTLWIHDSYRRGHFLCPLGAYGSSGIKLPDLVRGSYFDLNPPTVQLVVSHCKTTWQIAHGAWPIVSGQGGRRVR